MRTPEGQTTSEKAGAAAFANVSTMRLPRRRGREKAGANRQENVPRKTREIPPEKNEKMAGTQKKSERGSIVMRKAPRLKIGVAFNPIAAPSAAGALNSRRPK